MASLCQVVHFYLRSGTSDRLNKPRLQVTTPMRRPTRRATITITKQTSATTLVRESMISQRISGPVTVPKIDDSDNYNNASAPHLQPARLPPRFHYHDLVPFSFLGRWTNKGKKAARVKTRTLLNHNIPLQIGLYLVSWIFGHCRPFAIILIRCFNVEFVHYDCHTTRHGRSDAEYVSASAFTVYLFCWF